MTVRLAHFGSHEHSTSLLCCLHTSTFQSASVDNSVTNSAVGCASLLPGELTFRIHFGMPSFNQAT